MRQTWLAGGFLGCTLAACGAPEAFICEQDAQCGTGTCELAVGYCSFPDPSCPSGQRYGTYASRELAHACVGDEGGTATAGDTSEPMTGATTLSPTTSSPSSTSDDGTAATTDSTSDPSTTTGDPACPASWWDCSWAWRLPLDVTWDGPPLDDFPVRVALTPERIDLVEAAADGADLRFVTEQGTVLAHELEWLSAGGDRAELWLRVPELAAGARLWLYWGNPGAPDAQDPSSVWSEGYAAVWHMGPALDDATQEHALVDLATADTAGRIGRARTFDGTNSLLRPVTGTGFLTLFGAGGGTVSAWIRPTSWGQGQFGRIIDNATTNTTAGGWHVGLSGTGEVNPASLRFSLDYDVQRGTWETQPNTITLGTWQHVAATYDGTELATSPSLYIDGEPATLTTVFVPMGQPNLVSPHPATIGALGTAASRFFAGAIDELRLSVVRRAPEWIAAEALAGADGVLEYGAPEPLPMP